MDLLWKHRQAALRRSRCSTAASQHSDCSGSGCGSGFIRAATAEDVELGEHLQDRCTGKPSKGMVVTFQDVSYRVPGRGSSKGVTIMHHVTGHFEPGNVTAVLGPSGSSKTTLMNVVAGRTTAGVLSGTVTFGGQPPTSALLQRQVGYVEQFDTLVESLTCREMLLYTAQLKRPRTQPLQDKAAAVDSLLGKLGLLGCSGTPIGGALRRGISGGQAKRLNIGVALITDPSVLLLDEPTSGLDSYTALEVMSVVAQLAAEGTTVATTIHAPSAACFDLFDRLLVLMRGRLVYLGPSGDAAIEYFTSCCAARQPRVHENVSEWLLETVTLADRAAAKATSKHALARLYMGSYLCQVNQHLCAAYTDAGMGRRRSGLQVLKSLPGARPEDSAASLCRFCSSLQQPSSSGSPSGGGDGATISSSSSAGACTCTCSGRRGTTSALSSGGGASSAGGPCGLKHALGCRTYVTPAWWSLGVLLWYRTSRSYSSLAYVLPRLCEKLLFAAVVLSLFWGKGSDFSMTNAPVLSSLLFLAVLGPSCCAMIYLPGMAVERALYVRERNDGMYRPVVYLLYKMLDEFLLMVPVTAVSTAIMFLGCKLQGSFLLFWLVTLFTLANGTALAYFLAAVTPGLVVAMPILCFTLILKLLLCGFMIRTPAIPKFWAWAVKLNVVHYSWRALMVNQYSHEPLDGGPGSVSVLGYFGFSADEGWQSLRAVVGFFFAWSFLAWLALAFARTHKR